MTDLIEAIQGLLERPDVCPEARELIRASLRTQTGSASLEREVRALALPQAMPPSKQLLAQQLYASGKGYKAIARLMSLSRGTVSKWKARHGWQRSACPSTKGAACPPLLVWCASLSHDWLHLVNPMTLESSCGAKVGRFGTWTIQATPDLSKRCTRCLGHERAAA